MKTVVVFPDTATIFAAVCACIFVVVGVLGKSYMHTYKWIIVITWNIMYTFENTHKKLKIISICTHINKLRTVVNDIYSSIQLCFFLSSYFSFLNCYCCLYSMHTSSVLKHAQRHTISKPSASHSFPSFILLLFSSPLFSTVVYINLMIISCARTSGVW